MRGNESGFRGSNVVRQATSTFSISHRFALTVASYFFGSPAAQLRDRLNGPCACHVVLDFSVCIDAGEDEQSAIGLAIFPVTQVDDVTGFLDTREPNQRPRRHDPVGREEDDRARIKKRGFDKTTTAISC